MSRIKRKRKREGKREREAETETEREREDIQHNVKSILPWNSEVIFILKL